MKTGCAMEEDVKTKDVETLLGNPKKAILTMAIPTMVALVAQAANNLVDSAWVAGLGPNAMAAVGVVWPLFAILIGFSNGIGVGAASAIAKRIGYDNKDGADHSAAHAIIWALILSAIATPLLLLIAEPLLGVMGQEDILQDCLDYAYPILGMTVVFMLTGVMASILRAEGAAKRSMYILILAAILNIILDPFFIYDYGLGMGLAGAAWATVISEGVAVCVMAYWYFVKKDLFLKFRFKGFKFDKPISLDIFRVGLPASSEFFIMAIASAIMNIILIQAAGENAVAVYSTDWRLIQVLIIPMMGISMAVVPVCAAAYGARRSDKIKEAYIYSLKLAIGAMIVISIVTAIAAPVITMVFTYGDSAVLKDEMVKFLRIACTFLPFMALGMVSSSLFQALGMGLKSLISAAFRNFLLLPIAYIAMIYGTLTTIWWSVSFSEIVGCVLIGVWCIATIRFLMKGYHKDESAPMV